MPIGAPWPSHMMRSECELATIVNQRHYSCDAVVGGTITPSQSDARIYVESIVLRPASGSDDVMFSSAEDKSDAVWFPTAVPGYPKNWFGQGLFVGLPGRPVRIEIETPAAAWMFVAIGYYEAW
ncbi:MAG: hypothetical protein ACE15D_18725 [Candidatus Eisenbacteria bacterium]